MLTTPPYGDASAALVAQFALVDDEHRAPARDALIAAQEASGSERRPKLVAADRIYRSALPSIPVAAGRNLWLQDRRVEGYVIHGDGTVDFRGLRWTG